MEPRIKTVPVQLGDGKVIHVQVTPLGGEQDVSSRFLSFSGVTTAIEEVSKAVIESLAKAKPRKASVEFGIEVATEAGQLTALLVKGSGTATLKITLEWSKDA